MARTLPGFPTPIPGEYTRFPPVYARVTTFSGPPDRLEEGLRLFRENVMPWMRDVTGFRGFLALVDREHGRSLGITFWASEEAALDPEASGGGLRDEITESIGATLHSLEVYEVAGVEALALAERP
ncbi:MAG: antibiotic biosynthesis monooxygenase [Actinomycetota bacterium]|nr:antibiotic biosynthesis monooxygenase [Actinomycetota bacterium]